MGGSSPVTLALHQLPPLPFAPAACAEGAPGLYVHIPFCSAVCPYCDFAVTTGSLDRRTRFVDNLLLEIEIYRGTEVAIDTLYLGGGTPSALPAEPLARLLTALRERLPVVAGAEVTLEANPEDVTADRVADWRRLGIDRLSLGVQSFDRQALKLLGRRHDPETARRAVQVAQGGGFRSISIDLIYALPQQPPAVWLDTLRQAVALGPDHLSCYELTVHSGTPFARWAASGRLRQLEQEPRRELFDLTHGELEASGYEGYEVSSFARTSAHRSRHNQKYWRHVPYLGLGPSAHSFDGCWRWWNERDLGGYESQIRTGGRPVAGGEELDTRALALESVMLGLRTREGVDLDRMLDRFGVDLRAANRELISRLARRRLLTEEGSSLRPTRLGLAVADSLALDFDLG